MVTTVLIALFSRYKETALASASRSIVSWEYAARLLSMFVQSYRFQTRALAANTRGRC